MRYFLGLDNGGTVTKAALYDEKGREIATVAIETRSITPRADYVERDMEEMWEANCTVIRKVIEKSGVNAQDIRCVAACGHGKGLYLWGKDNKPARNGIISTDNRAWAYAKRWAKDGTEKKLFELTCQHILACQPVALLAWIKDNEPQTLDNIQWIFECKDYIRFRLTGTPGAEFSDYSGANLVNLHTRSYDPRILALLGLSELEHALPPLCSAAEICGYVTEEAAQKSGLAVGTPVAGGLFDINACALAVNALDEEHICMIAGTWSINEYIRKDPVLDGSVLMNSLFCISEYYLVEECSPTSAGNNEWFIQTLCPELAAECKRQGKSIYDEINALVASIPPEEACPVFLPFLMASNVHPNAKGCFVGMSAHHTRAHMFKSIYEGVAFSHKQHLDKLLASKRTPTRSIRLAGGVARSEVWAQMFADIMGLPVEVSDVNETGAFGCAICGAVASETYGSLREAADAMCGAMRTFLPNPAHTVSYGAKYALYRKVIDALDSVWDDMQQR